MNDLHEFEHKLKPLHSVSLSREERDEMKENIRLFMAANPARTSPFEKFFLGFRAPQDAFFMRPVLASLLIIFIIGTGTSYTAADALPGDFLYPIKIHVNENIEKALAFTEEARANQNAALAIRRIEEAESLASEGRLTPEVRAEIEDRFNEHAEQFEIRAALLAAKEGGVEAASDAQSNLEASLKAHAEVLADLVLAAQYDEEEELSPIVQTVTDRVRSVETARTETERTISKRVGDDIRVAATAKKRSVERELLSTHSRKSAPEPVDNSAAMMMSTTIEETVDAKLPADPVTEAFEEGSARLEEGQYGEAFRMFQGAIRTIHQEKLDSDARKRLKLDLRAQTPKQEEPDGKSNNKDGEEDDRDNEEEKGF